MTPSPYPAPLGCTEPTVGAHATQALGEVPHVTAAEHVASCPACQLQRVAFEGLERGAIPPSLDFRERLRQRAVALVR
jgi:hypothetical protein